jgi:hypothetical protein
MWNTRLTPSFRAPAKPRRMTKKMTRQMMRDQAEKNLRANKMRLPVRSLEVFAMSYPSLST